MTKDFQRLIKVILSKNYEINEAPVEYDLKEKTLKD